ncbi:MAG: DUF4129 domain-containing protein [Gaiellaceae bacterium]
MSTRRWLPLGLGVTVLLVVAGIASHGRPLSRSRGHGPTPVFFDYAFTTLVVLAIFIFATVAWSMLQIRRSEFKPRRGRFQLLGTFIFLAVSAIVALLFLHSAFGKRLHALAQRESGQGRGAAANTNRHNPTARPARLRWDEVALVAALVGGAAALAYATRRGTKPPRPLRLRRQEAVSLALDQSLDDLRSEPDLRKAIVAAFARMERALALAGLPRHPAEAPFEYVERALRELETSSTSARRLTDLFEWAKFSQHEPDSGMRDEAIDALAAVRDELRAPQQELAA